jgi:hypothetical protein
MSPLPLQRRVEGRARTFVTLNTSWLMTSRRSPGRSQEQHVSVYDRSGGLVHRFRLPSKAHSWSSDFRRNWVTVLCKDATVRIYDESGELLDEFDMLGNHDVASQLGYVSGGNLHSDSEAWSALRIETPYAMRSVDYDRPSNRVLYTFQDCAWCRTRGGDPLWSIAVPGHFYPGDSWLPTQVPPKISAHARKFGLPPDPTSMEVASWMSREVTGGSPLSLPLAVSEEPPGLGLKPLQRLRPEVHMGRIEHARFTEQGAATLGTTYGLNIEVSDFGEPVGLWSSPGEFQQVAADGAARFGVAGPWLIAMEPAAARIDGEATRLSEIDPVTLVCSTPDRTFGGDGWAAGLSGDQLLVMAAPTWEPTAYTLPKWWNALLPVNGGLECRVGAKRFAVPLT